MYTNGKDGLIYYRLIALWVLCEAMLGGIIHGFRVPVSGLIVGSCAVVCICLLAYYAPERGVIIKAMVIVAVFKMLLSPQAPPPAYIAVFFQGLMGEILFWNRRFYRISCLLLGIIALLESALQHILVLTIIYGINLWKAINDFISSLTAKPGITNYSFFIITSYILIHVVVGVLVGMWAGTLPQNIKQLGAIQEKYSVITGDQSELTRIGTRKNKWQKKILFIIWLLLILLYVQSTSKFGTPFLPPHIVLRIFLRSIIIFLSWYFLVGPLLKKLLNSWLQKKKEQSRPDIQQVLQLLPATQELISISWQMSADKKGLKRMILWSKIVLANIFHAADPGQKYYFRGRKIFILTGPIQTGKTTKLLDWSEKRNDVYGILTPIVNGERIFMDAHTREQFSMKAQPEEKNILQVGRFSFSKKAFQRAIGIIRKAHDQNGWLVIDEIGPLEIRGEGFSTVVKELLKQTSYIKPVLVIRDSILPQALEYFKINSGQVIMMNGNASMFKTYA